MNEPRLLVGDGNLGLWSALRNIFPGAEEQRCWNHRLVNLLTQVPKQRQGEARELLTKIPYQASARQARQKQRVFQNWCLDHGYERAAAADRRELGTDGEFLPVPRAGPLAAPAHEQRGRVAAHTTAALPLLLDWIT